MLGSSAVTALEVEKDLVIVVDLVVVVDMPCVRLRAAVAAVAVTAAAVLLITGDDVLISVWNIQESAWSFESGCFDFVRLFAV